MARYNEKLAERITALVEEDAYTVATNGGRKNRHLPRPCMRPNAGGWTS